MHQLCLLCALMMVAGTPGMNHAQSVAHEQTGLPGTIRGLILTRRGVPLAGVEIALIGESVSFEQRRFSDAQGEFSFLAIPPGGFLIRIKSEGFAAHEESLEIRPGDSLQLTFTMEILPLFEQITVTATRTERKLADVPVHVSVLTEDDLKRSPALTLDDALRQLPSFSLFRRTSSLVAHPTTEGVSLRGVGASGASRTLVLLDGVPHNDAFGNWVYWSKIPKSEIERIEVAEGGVSSLYGSSAMAGVINIITRKPEANLLILDGQAGMRSTGDLDVYASRNAGPFALGIGGRAFRTGGYALVREEQRGPVDINATSRSEVLTWRADYNPAPGITLFHNGRLFGENRINGTPLQENSTHEVYLGGGLRARKQGGSDWQMNVFSHLQSFESSFSPQVPRHRTSLTIDHASPALLNTSLQVRYESLRFDDDLNQTKLPGFWIVDVSGFRPLPRFGEVYFGFQNILNRDYSVQASPVPLRGLPFMVIAGLRFSFVRR